jgi:hypothetical protein
MGQVSHLDKHILINRLHWFKILRVKGDDITVANIYAHNKITKRCGLWELMVKYLPKDCGWILAGDFNMVEHQANKTSMWEMHS